LELPKVDLVSPSSRAAGHELAGESFLAAGHAFGQRYAGVVAALDDRAVQEIIDRHLAVDGGKHGRAAGRRAAPAPGVLADAELVRELDLAFLDGVEDDLDRHQLHHAGRRAQLVGVLFEQDAATGGFHQDRGRGIAVERVVFLLGALHAVVSGIDRAARGKRQDKGHRREPAPDRPDRPKSVQKRRFGGHCSSPSGAAF
jgi:hypothetical protein